MNQLFIDFETAYDTKAKYDLKNISILEYVRDSRFKCFGACLASLDGEIQWVTAKQLPTVFAEIEWSNTAVVAHNIKFDGFILKNRYGVQPLEWIDTKGLAKAVLGKKVKGFSLDVLARHYGLEPKGHLQTNGMWNLSQAGEAELAEYTKHDVFLCRELYKRLIVDFPSEQLPMLSWTIQTFVDPKFELNVPLLEQCTINERNRKEMIFAEVGIDKAVFSSNPKFAALLKEKGYPVPTKISPRTGLEIPALALGDTEFRELMETENPELKQLCDARVAAKSTLLETRSAKLAAIGKTGKWPFDIEFSGATQTHRFSGSNGAGGNPQNLTRGSALRGAIQAPAGHMLVVADFSNIEMRLVAYLAQDPGLVQGIEQGRDLYCDFASTFFSRQITKADKIERMFGKTSILGLGYGMGAAKFKRTVKLQTGMDLSDEEAQKAVDLYRAKYYKVPLLWDKLHNSISKMLEDKEQVLLPGLKTVKHAIVLPDRLPIKYPNLRNKGKQWVYDEWKRSTSPETVNLYGGKVLENISQALAGVLCKSAAGKFLDVLAGLVHDEIILIVPENEAQRYADELQSAMREAPLWLPKLKLDAEVHIGRNWKEAK